VEVAVGRRARDDAWGPAAPEREVVAAARRGSRSAQDELIRRHHRSCVGLALHLLSDEDAALDAAQDACVRALEKLRSLKDDGRFRPWLMRIVVNRCRSIRRRARARPPEEPLSPSLPAADGPASDQAERSRAVAEAVAGLPPAQREAVVLFYYHGLKAHEAADVLGCSTAAVKTRLFEARRRLADDLEAWL